VPYVWARGIAAADCSRLRQNHPPESPDFGGDDTSFSEIDKRAHARRAKSHQQPTGGRVVNTFGTLLLRIERPWLGVPLAATLLVTACQDVAPHEVRDTAPAGSSEPERGSIGESTRSIR